MNNKDFMNVVKNLQEEVKQMHQTKGLTYGDKDEQFANFKEISKMTGLCPYKVWMVYFMKHIQAIRSFVNQEYHDTETIQGRIIDASAYLNLLYGMIEESETI